MLLLINSFWADLLFIELLIVGVQKILVNSIPHKTNSLPNDGYIIRLLKKSVAVRKDYAMYLKLYGKLFLEEEIKPQEFKYEREPSTDADEVLYYNEILDILSSVE